jgi:hypothetical protein
VSGDSFGNTIRGNSIDNNATLAIDIADDLVTANDANDGDVGPNRRQNFPVLTSSASNASGTQVTGSLNSRPNKQYLLDFYASPACDGSGNGEAKTYVGSTSVATNGAGNVNFVANLTPVVANGQKVVATATDVVLGDTSELSLCVNNGGIPTVSISPTAPSVGESAGNANLTVNLSSAPTLTPVTVTWSTTNGTATGSDFTGQPGATVTFNVGETSKPISVPITADTVDEEDESFTVNLSNPVNTLIAAGGGTSTVTITDDDAAPTVSISGSAAVVEATGGPASFTATLSAASAKTVTVVATSVNGSARGGFDFTVNALQLTFLPGETSKPFTVSVLNDTTDENNENFFAQLVNPVNATIGTAAGAAVITDDDAPPVMTIGDVSIAEGNSGSTLLTFTLTLSQLSERTVKANASTANGTAAAPVDFKAQADKTRTIRPGSISVTFVVTINGDTTVEPDETMFVNLTVPSNVTIGDPQGQGTILNDD